MKVIIQRVEKAGVNIRKPGSDNEYRNIKRGMVVLLGVGKGDTLEDVKYLADKISGLRIFSDESGKMNLSVMDIQGDILLVSQFTLYADCRHGRRPDFTQASEPESAEQLYNHFITELKNKGINIQTGEFAASMLVEIHNDGPVTIILDSKDK